MNKKSNVREWIESIVIAFLLAMFIRTFFIQAFKIPSGSMRMTLIEGDRLMVNKLRYGPKIPFTRNRIPGYSKPDRGDIVVFIFPGTPKKDFIKRLIAFGEKRWKSSLEIFTSTVSPLRMSASRIFFITTRGRTVWRVFPSKFPKDMCAFSEITVVPATTAATGALFPSRM